MKRLYSTTDPTEAEILRAMLRDAGIESTLDNEGGADYAIGMPISVSPLGIHVSDEDAATGAEILAAHFEKKPLATEDDPDAPPEMSLDESAVFEAKVRDGRSKGRFWLAFFLLLPTAVWAVSMLLSGNGIGAAVGAGVLIGAVGIGWLLHVLAKPAAQKKGPAS